MQTLTHPLGPSQDGLVEPYSISSVLYFQYNTNDIDSGHFVVASTSDNYLHIRRADDTSGYAILHLSSLIDISTLSDLTLKPNPPKPNEIPSSPLQGQINKPILNLSRNGNGDPVLTVALPVIHNPTSSKDSPREITYIASINIFLDELILYSTLTIHGLVVELLVCPAGIVTYMSDNTFKIYHNFEWKTIEPSFSKSFLPSAKILSTCTPTLGLKSLSSTDSLTQNPTVTNSTTTPTSAFDLLKDTLKPTSAKQIKLSYHQDTIIARSKTHLYLFSASFLPTTGHPLGKCISFLQSRLKIGRNQFIQECRQATSFSQIEQVFQRIWSSLFAESRTIDTVSKKRVDERVIVTTFTKFVKSLTLIQQDHLYSVPPIALVRPSNIDQFSPESLNFCIQVNKWNSVVQNCFHETCWSLFFLYLGSRFIPNHFAWKKHALILFKTHSYFGLLNSFIGSHLEDQIFTNWTNTSTFPLHVVKPIDTVQATSLQNNSEYDQIDPHINFSNQIVASSLTGVNYSKAPTIDQLFLQSKLSLLEFCFLNPISGISLEFFLNAHVEPIQDEDFMLFLRVISHIRLLRPNEALITFNLFMDKIGTSDTFLWKKLVKEAFAEHATSHFSSQHSSYFLGGSESRSTQIDSCAVSQELYDSWMLLFEPQFSVKKPSMKVDQQIMHRIMKIYACSMFLSCFEASFASKHVCDIAMLLYQQIGQLNNLIHSFDIKPSEFPIPVAIGALIIDRLIPKVFSLMFLRYLSSSMYQQAFHVLMMQPDTRRRLDSLRWFISTCVEKRQFKVFLNLPWHYFDSPILSPIIHKDLSLDPLFNESRALDSFRNYLASETNFQRCFIDTSEPSKLSFRQPLFYLSQMFPTRIVCSHEQTRAIHSNCLSFESCLLSFARKSSCIPVTHHSFYHLAYLYQLHVKQDYSAAASMMYEYGNRFEDQLLASKRSTLALFKQFCGSDDMKISDIAQFQTVGFQKLISKVAQLQSPQVFKSLLKAQSEAYLIAYSTRQLHSKSASVSHLTLSENPILYQKYISSITQLSVLNNVDKHYSSFSMLVQDFLTPKTQPTPSEITFSLFFSESLSILQLFDACCNLSLWNEALRLADALCPVDPPRTQYHQLMLHFYTQCALKSRSGDKKALILLFQHLEQFDDSSVDYALAIATSFLKTNSDLATSSKFLHFLVNYVGHSSVAIKECTLTNSDYFSHCLSVNPLLSRNPKPLLPPNNPIKQMSHPILQFSKLPVRLGQYLCQTSPYLFARLLVKFGFFIPAATVVISWGLPLSLTRLKTSTVPVGGCYVDWKVIDYIRSYFATVNGILEDLGTKDSTVGFPNQFTSSLDPGFTNFMSRMRETSDNFDKHIERMLYHLVNN